MKKCPFCGADLASEARFCMYCTKELDSKTVFPGRARKNRRPLRIALVIAASTALVCALIFGAVAFFGAHEEKAPENEPPSAQREILPPTESGGGLPKPETRMFDAASSTLAPGTTDESPSTETPIVTTETPIETTTPVSTDTPVTTETPIVTTETPISTETPPHEHTFTEWKTVRTPTCTVGGAERRVCTVCGYAQERPLSLASHTPAIDPAVSPTCEQGGLTEGSHCLVCGLILTEQSALPALGHDYVYGVCTRCGAIKDDEELIFSLSDDGTSYIFSRAGKFAGRELTLPAEYDGLPVTKIAPYAFKDLKTIEKITLSEGIAEVGDFAFDGCTALKEVSVPSSVSSVGQDIFSGCDRLEKLFFDASCPPDPDNPFMSAPSLYSITLGMKTVPDNAFFYGYGYNLCELSFAEGVEHIGAYTIYDCENFSILKLPLSLRSIDENAFDLAYAPENGINLTLDVPDLAKWATDDLYLPVLKLTERCVNPIEAFGYAQLRVNGSEEIEPLPPGAVTHIRDHAFRYLGGFDLDAVLCEGLESIGEYAFQFSFFTDPSAWPSTLKHIGKYAFANSSIVNLMGLPDGFASFGENAFEYCPRLLGAIIPAGVSELPEFLFNSCPLLCGAILKEGLTKIGDGAFLYCEAMTEVEIPDTVAEIGANAFMMCSFISVRLPASLTVIGAYAFEVPVLKFVFYGGTEEEWSRIMIDRGNECLTQANIDFSQ